MEQSVIPELRNLLKSNEEIKNNRMEAIIGIYYRMYYWFKSISELRRLYSFQTLAAGARTLFELALDLTLICKTTNPNYPDMFWLYIGCENLSLAENRCKFAKKHPEANLDVTENLKFISAKKNDIENQAKRFWHDERGNYKRPIHWTGDKNLPQRVEEADKLINNYSFSLFYYGIYKNLSWNVHPGMMGFAEINDEYFENIYNGSLDISCRILVLSTKYCVNALGIEKQIRDFDSFIQRIMR